MARLIAHGCKLYMGDGGNGAEDFDLVPHTGAIGYDVADGALADVTSSTDDAHEELVGMADIVELDFTVVFDLSQPTHLAIRDAAVDHEPINWRIITKSGTTCAFSARIRSRKFSFGLVNKAEEMGFKLRVYSASDPVDA